MSEGNDEQKFDGGKPPLSMLPRRPLEQISYVIEYGAKKYCQHGWRKGRVFSRDADAALRHIFQWNEGEDLDPESGLPHLAHAACDLLFLLESIVTHPEFDNRYKPEGTDG